MEQVTVKITNGIKDGEFAVLFKNGRKLLGWTQRWNSDGLWHNHQSGFSFSASDTLDRAVEIMQEHIENCLDPFGTRKIEFTTRK